MTLSWGSGEPRWPGRAWRWTGWTYAWVEPLLAVRWSAAGGRGGVAVDLEGLVVLDAVRAGLAGEDGPAVDGEPSAGAGTDLEAAGVAAVGPTTVTGPQGR